MTADSLESIHFCAPSRKAVRRLSVILVALLTLAGCATYEPQALATQDSLTADVRHIQVDTATLPFAAQRTYRVDPSDGLDITEVAILAVVANPDLALARADAGLASAQAFSAGLLPDPQFSVSRDSVLAPTPGATVAYNLGLNIDIAALLAHRSQVDAARKEARVADLNLLWKEWQAVGQARGLFVKIRAQEQTDALLRSAQAVYDERLVQAQEAARRGLITSDAVTAPLTASNDVLKQRNDLQRAQNQARHDLNALLGLKPEVVLTLAGPISVDGVDEAQARRAASGAGTFRPDLLALRLGYQAQDDRYRCALIAQFPTFTFGPTRSRDTSNVNTSGFSLGISLPVFNRNRGNIAVAKVTRERLSLEYQQRLNTTVIEVDRLLAEQRLIVAQLEALGPALAELQASNARAEQAYTARDLDALTLTTSQQGVLARRLEQVALEQTLAEQRVALSTLIGSDLVASDRSDAASFISPRDSDVPAVAAASSPRTP